MSDAFAYRDGELHAEAVPIRRIADAVGTPFYLYSTASFTAQYRALADALASLDPLICYAVKANSNLAVLRLFARLGAGADVVSEGELRRALAAGIPAARIVFSGVGKTRAELGYALAADIHQINVESFPELRRLSEIATAAGKLARVAIRVNPDVDAGSHDGISTGRKGDKFGIAREDIAAAYRLAADLPGIEPAGLAVHIGSKIEDLGPSRTAFVRLAELVRELRAAGLAVRRLDVGGGLTVPYGKSDPVVSPAGIRRLRLRNLRPSRPGAGVRAGAFPGRRRRRAGRERRVRKGRTRPLGRHRRCGDERFDPARPVQGVSRDRPGTGARKECAAGSRDRRRAGLREH